MPFYREASNSAETADLRAKKVDKANKKEAYMASKSVITGSWDRMKWITMFDVK